MSRHRTNCRLGGHGPPGSGAEYSWGAHETFSKGNWENETLENFEGYQH